MTFQNSSPRLLLSILWVFIILNFFARDLHELGRPGMLEQMMSGTIDGVLITDTLMLLGGIMIEVPILMTVFALLLPQRINRWANIDMALAIIEEDLGKPAAIAMARSLVTPMVRSGGQSQFSAELTRQSNDADGRFANLHRWISNNIAQIMSVEDMADFCGMSSRNFSRKYTEVLGQSPAKALEAMRVDVARTLLGTTDYRLQTTACR